MNGMIFNIQDFCVDDGCGIRTTIFLKGCPLRCVWCHNPESHKYTQEIFYNSNSCANCGKCVTICPNKAHTIENGQHVFDRRLCNQCGQCTQICISQALKLCGEEKEASDIIEKVRRNKIFYEHSNGGITISGGEPLFQSEFSLELCRLAKQNNISVYMETSGYGKTEDVRALLPYVDCFLFDYKIESAYAKEYIGQSDALIMENLSIINNAGKKIILRCPIIPQINFNDRHFASIVDIVRRLKQIIEIHLLVYHPLGIEKAEQLDKKVSYKNKLFLDKKELDGYAKFICEETGVPTIVL